jgi:hypothetical protein
VRFIVHSDASKAAISFVGSTANDDFKEPPPNVPTSMRKDQAAYPTKGEALS